MKRYLILVLLTISALTEMKLRRRRGNFIEATQTKKAVHITLVTPYGLKKNSHSAIAQNIVTLHSLF